MQPGTSRSETSTSTTSWSDEGVGRIRLTPKQSLKSFVSFVVWVSFGPLPGEVIGLLPTHAIAVRRRAWYFKPV